MTKQGAQAGRDLKQLVAQNHERDFQLAMNDVQIRFECHQRAVSSTTQFEKAGDIERTTPVEPAAQLAYAKELYDWVTEALEAME
jgi:hypothetical protein